MRIDRAVAPANVDEVARLVEEPGRRKRRNPMWRGARRCRRRSSSSRGRARACNVARCGKEPADGGTLRPEEPADAGGNTR